MNRVVVTGIGMVTPLAYKTKDTWNRLIEGSSGINRISSFNTEDLSVKIAGQIPEIDAEFGFNPNAHIEKKDQRKMDDFIIYAVAAADQAIEDSGWEAKSDEDYLKAGVLVGSGIGGLQSIAKANETLNERGPKRMSPFFIPSCLINLASGQISIKYGFKGPNHSVVTACSTGAHAIGESEPKHLVSVFILPPSTAELERRLKTRGQDSVKEVKRRMSEAHSEITHWAEYDYIIINNNVDKTLEKLKSILNSERLKRERQIGLIDFVREVLN